VRRARLTYQGAFHHAMNRGYEGRPIFKEDSSKDFFLDLIVKLQELLKIRVLAYCIMDNHYHLVIQNSSGRMSDFFKQLNGQFGHYYRSHYGGKGYVFQSRYKSLLIQDDSYLLMVIAYVLKNPVKSGICKSFREYQWSSGYKYFSKKEDTGIDFEYVESLFGSMQELMNLVNGIDFDKLPTVTSEMGKIIGGENRIAEMLERSDRRNLGRSKKRKRRDDRYFEPLEKIFYEFEKSKKVKIEEIDTNSRSGKRLRSELLVYLKELGGMKYSEIAELDLFGDLTINSLGPIYYRYRKK